MGLDLNLPVEAIPGGLLEGNVLSRSRHPNGVSVESDLEIGLQVHHRVLWGFDRTTYQSQTQDVDRHKHETFLPHRLVLSDCVFVLLS